MPSPGRVELDVNIISTTPNTQNPTTAYKARPINRATGLIAHVGSCFDSKGIFGLFSVLPSNKGLPERRGQLGCPWWAGGNLHHLYSGRRGNKWEGRLEITWWKKSDCVWWKMVEHTGVGKTVNTKFERYTSHITWISLIHFSGTEWANAFAPVTQDYPRCPTQICNWKYWDVTKKEWRQAENGLKLKCVNYKGTELGDW